MVRTEKIESCRQGVSQDQSGELRLDELVIGIAELRGDPANPASKIQCFSLIGLNRTE